MHFLLSALTFVIILGVLVLVHELGHFTAAKIFGMKVFEFAFGFGPKLAGLFKKNETEYNIRAIPMGGFVRIAGMEPGEDGDVEGGFNSKPIWQRSLVILAGPFMSLVLGYVVFLLMGFVWGYPSSTASTTKVVMVTKDMPAARAGLLPGDEIKSINGTRIQDGEKMIGIIRSSNGKEMVLSVQRDNKNLVIKATPVLREAPNGKKVYQLGFAPEPKMERVGPIESMKRGSVQTAQFLKLTVEGIFSKQIKQAGGIVAIGVMTDKAVRTGLESVLFLLAALSLTLGVINLIPWPILDGGHILYLAIEKIRGKRLEPQIWYAIQTVGLAVIIMVAIFMVGYDIYRLPQWTNVK